MLLPEYMLYLNNKPMKTKTKTQPKKKTKTQKNPVVFFSRKPMCKRELKQWQVLNV